MFVPEGITMALSDVKVGDKLVCRKPEQCNILPREIVLTVKSTNHPLGELQLTDSPYRLYVVNWNYKQNPDDFLPYVENVTDLTPVQYEYRYIESHPSCANYGVAYEWETIEPHKIDDIKAYIKNGHNYQTRTLFTGASIAKELEDIQRYTDKTIIKERIEKLILTLKG